MIHQLLMLAKVESTQTLAKQPVELANVIKQVIADLAPIAFKQDQQLSFHGEVRVYGEMSYSWAFYLKICWIMPFVIPATLAR